jgi:DNA repair protein RadC
MYDIAKLEKSDAVGSLLWNPDKLLPSLYELRNKGIISKVSEIDSIRQFTISYDLETIVDKLVKGAW